MPKSTKRVLKPSDPLYQLFEHFLLTRSYESSAQFTKQLAENYLAYLDSTPAHMPYEAREACLEDLASEAHEMLVRRMYGTVGTRENDDWGSVHQCRDGRKVEALPLNMPDLKSKNAPGEKP